MGSSSSKFRKHLQHGDEYAALQLYYNSSDMRKALDPNSSYGDNYSHDTPLHYAARHGMKSLLRIFLTEHGGNPNKKNSRNETAVHCVCMALNSRNYAVQQRRLECLGLILHWRGATLADGEIERADLATQDEKMNTCLHYAAASGLKRCVELLVCQSAPLFMENAQKQTPCDCAEKCNNNEIALYLESKMVFSNEEENADDMDNLLDEMEAEESQLQYKGYSGLRAQDLQEAKDQLLVETSDMLRVPLFTAEALLRNHEWSREALLEAWMSDAIACCDKCGVVPPATLFDGRPNPMTEGASSGLILDLDLRTPTHTVPPPIDTICDICACLIPTADEPVPMSCDHQFCRGCWERYLTVKIQEGEAHNITCPGFECSKLVPVEVIETLVSRDMSRRYLQFDIKAFVDSNPSIKWCPYPGCGRAVRLPDSDNPMSPTFRGLNDMGTAGLDFSHAVDCGNGHLFCWECLGEPHEPASCDNWKRWSSKIGDIKPEQLGSTDVETEVASNCLWLVTNSKSCPNCKSPIQKNEGCNHMKCSKCKHDFCWVCLEGWKKHSSSTGGYFRCNRYEVVKKVEEFTDLLKAEAEVRNKKMQELNRFMHYYTRFKNHENSFKLEEPLLSTAKEKMMILAKAVTDVESSNMETKFVEDAVHQLLKARRVLKCSYVYGFYLGDTGYKKPIFEFMQTELEECTETLSEMVARPYLRTPRCKIIQTAHLVQRKRHEFLTAVVKGLVPPDTSPGLKRKRKKYSVELDDDLKKVLLASVQDPSNPWVKDPSGKHTNVAALLDWPEESDDSDTEDTNKPTQVTITTEEAPAEPSIEEGSSSACTSATAVQEVCLREGCPKPQARNPRTGKLHDHCSMRCMHHDRGHSQANPESQPGVEFFTDYQMDLLRALEMSRLQFLREMGSLRPGTDDRSPHSPGQMLSATPSPSPRATTPTMMEPVEVDPPLPSIVLSDPPKGRHRSGEQSEAEESPPTVGEFDTELQRALEISRLALHDEEEDLKLAIELSLQDSQSAEEGSSTDNADPSDPNTGADAPYSAEYSSIVTRVPNKSIEDLVAEGGMSDGAPPSPGAPSSAPPCPTDYVGACGGNTRSPDDLQVPYASMSHSFNQGLHNQPCLHQPAQIFFSSDPNVRPCCGQTAQRAQRHEVKGQRSPRSPRSPRTPPRSPRMPPSNPFGIMKDISVNNIVASDSDKMQEFAEKDFSQVFSKKLSFHGDVHAADCSSDCHLVPPSSPFSPYGPRSPTRLATPPKQDVVLSGSDPWLRRDEINNRCHGNRSPRATSPRRSYSSSFSEIDSRLPPPPPPPLTSSYYGHQGNTNSGHHGRKMGAYRKSWDAGFSSSEYCVIPDSPQRRESAPKTPEQSLDSALQNLSDLTRRLTRDRSIDPDDIVINSQVLESLLQGAEGYHPSGSHSPSPPPTHSQGEQDGSPDTERVVLLEGGNRRSSSDKDTDTDRDAVFV